MNWKLNLWRAGLMFALATTAFAHDGKPPQPHDLWSAWSLEPLVILSLLLALGLYARGVVRIWRQAGVNYGLRRWEVAAFLGGWLSLVVALVSPLDALGSALFAAHMTQHEILMLIAAPLLVLGRPLAASLWALPVKLRRAVVAVGRQRLLRRAWQFLLHPVVAWLLHAAVLWAWHVPALFQATLTNDGVHAAQHLSFFGSALLFCEALFYGRGARAGDGVAVFYLFTTAVHTSVLGALLTFSDALWYPAYRNTTAVWGLTPLEDQQLGGLIMWVPAGVVYVVAGLALFARWLSAAARRAEVLSGD